MKEPILFSGELKSTEDMCTFYSVNLQHSCIEFEIRVGGEFSETMPPSPKDGLIIGSGKPGLIKVIDRLRRHLSDYEIQVIIEPSGTAMKTYNQMYAGGKNIADGFHLTCWS
jgi:hypothetical protein